MLRIGLAVLIALVCLIALGPLVSFGGEAAIGAQGIVGMGLFAYGSIIARHVLAGIGFLCILVAGMALWIIDK